MKKTTERRLKENEIIFREANQNIQKFIEETTGKLTSVFRFYCECSNQSCREKITMTPAQYKAAQKTNRQFVVLPGHENPKIEKVTKSTACFYKIEKFGEMPEENALSIALTRLARE